MQTYVCFKVGYDMMLPVYIPHSLQIIKTIAYYIQLWQMLTAEIRDDLLLYTLHYKAFICILWFILPIQRLFSYADALKPHRFRLKDTSEH